MRRTLIALFAVLILQLLVPSPAAAWWEWLEELSGPGRWTGPNIDARLVCFVQKTTRQQRAAANDLNAAAQKAASPFASVNVDTLKQRDSRTSVGDAITTWQAAVTAWQEAVDEWARLAGASAFKGAALLALIPEARATAERSLAAAATAATQFENARADKNQEKAFDAAAAKALGDAKTVLASYERATEVMTAAAQDGHSRFLPFAGVIVSACRLDPGERRRAAIDLGMRFLWTKDRRYVAEGERINLTILEPAFSWKIFDDERYDFVDYGVGAGAFWIASKSFPSVSGIMLEPIRFDLHGATRWPRWTRAAVVRLGLLSFPEGFDLNAFAPRDGLTPGRIGRDWVWSIGLFADIEHLYQRRAR